MADRVNIPLPDRYDRAKAAIRELEGELYGLGKLLLETQAEIGFAVRVFTEENERGGLSDEAWSAVLTLDDRVTKILQAIGLLNEDEDAERQDNSTTTD